ncbi:MAG: RnfABCDGE type electron transport complex subunit G [Clostridia bacterium]|nr:RnfABCDGE type electron transport complex subunit G [Clostridia bacterium]MBR0509650.1 RnfABCDGE type electron transport complex subunit G [Clostridia bacterium]MBR0537751.1 RnfABCDGE type electron transport complex subunit G [Clostridia bacterium]
MKTKDILLTALKLFLICAVAAGLLAAVNGVTAKKIDEINTQNALAAQKEVLPDAVSFEDLTLTDGAAGAAGKDADGNTVGYVFTTSANSYGGTLKLMTGFDADGAVTGISILEINDTPGLGMNAKRPDWLGQFKGRTDDLQVTKDGGTGDAAIDAITSATITSRAVVSAVNAARELYREAAAQ